MSEAARLESIIEEIRQLTPAGRRRLLRYLRVAGLLEREELLTDRNRLRVAPALGLPRAAPTPNNKAGRSEPHSRATSRTPGRGRDNGERTQISGRVVIGAPPSGEEQLDPHFMAPLPGQAPERPIVIRLNMPSTVTAVTTTGSYVFEWPGSTPQIVQVRFAEAVPTEYATYETLSAALDTLVKRLSDGGIDPGTARLDVHCPSDEFIDQLTGEEPISEPGLRARRDHVDALLDQIGEWRLMRTRA